MEIALSRQRARRPMFRISLIRPGENAPCAPRGGRSVFRALFTLRHSGLLPVTGQASGTPLQALELRVGPRSRVYPFPKCVNGHSWSPLADVKKCHFASGEYAVAVL